MNRNQKPLVSIGLPTYNREKYLPQAIGSLLAQSYTNFELIISDNASTDNTINICNEYAAKDPRIKYFRNDENIGAWPNFKRVLDLSKGDFFMWAADDDWWHPHYIEALLNPHIDEISEDIFLVASDSLYIKGDYIVDLKRIFLPKSSPSWKNYLKFLRSLSPDLVYGLFTLSILKKYMPDQAISHGIGEDVWLLTKIFAETGKKIVTINLGLRYNRIDTSYQNSENLDSEEFLKKTLPKGILSIILSGKAYPKVLKPFFALFFLFCYRRGLAFK